MFAKLSHEQFCRYHCQTQTPSAESLSVIRCFAPLCSIHFWGGGAGSGDQSLPRPYTLASNLVRWVEARAKLDDVYAVFLGRGLVFHSLPLMSPAFSILIEMENLQQITTRNTAVFQQLSLHEATRSWYLAFFDSWNSSVLSCQGTVNSTIITYFGYTDHRNISGRRFERVTSLRKCYVSSFVCPLLKVLGFVQQAGICLVVCFCLPLSH